MMMRDTLKSLAHHLTAGLLVLVFLLPLYWVLVASLRETGLAPPQSIEWWPAGPNWQNYQAIFRLLPLGRYVVNSLLVAALAVPITVATAAPAGFALSQLPADPRRRLLRFSLAVLLVPSAAVWLFRFQILRWLGLLDSLWALVMPAFAATSPLFVLLFYWSYRRIPGELFDAARLDGAGVGTCWLRVAMPLVQPTTVGVLVLSFVLYWSDFVSPILYLYQPQNYTLAIGLQLLKQLDATNWPLLMAGAVVMTIPILLLFFALQRFFLSDASLANLMERN